MLLCSRIFHGTLRRCPDPDFTAYKAGLTDQVTSQGCKRKTDLGGALAWFQRPRVSQPFPFSGPPPTEGLSLMTLEVHSEGTPN